MDLRPHLPGTILMLHGLRSSHAGLLKLAEQFPGHRVIIPDFPGYGGSAPLAGRHTVAAYTAFVGSFIRELKLQNLTLLGHSFGALIGLAYAATTSAEINHLVMISPIPKPNIISRAGTIYYRIGQALPAPLDKRWLTNRRLHRPIRQLVARATDPVTHAYVMAEGEHELQVLEPHINVQNYLSLAATDPTLWLASLTVPTLVVAGDADPLTRLADVIASYDRPGIIIKVIEGMGHFAPAEIPTEIAVAVTSWLRTPQGASV